MAGTWTNSDGLLVKFNSTAGTVGTGGEYEMDGPLRVTEVKISLTGLATSAAVLDQHVIIPSGARIERIELINETAATSGGSAALNVGLQRLDRSTELDYDGLVAAAALSTFNSAGEYNSITPGGTAAGALMGTTLSYPGVITADYDTAAFTAGKVIVRVYWFSPQTTG